MKEKKNLKVFSDRNGNLKYKYNLKYRHMYSFAVTNNALLKEKKSGVKKC